MVKISEKQFNQAMRGLSQSEITPDEISEAETRGWANFSQLQERKTMSNSKSETKSVEFKPFWLRGHNLAYAIVVVAILISAGAWYGLKPSSTPMAELNTVDSIGTVAENTPSTTLTPSVSSTPTTTPKTSTSTTQPTVTPSYVYKTDKGTEVSIQALVPSNNTWQQVAEARTKNWLAWFIGTAHAASKEFIVDFSKNFDDSDSFDVISHGSNDMFLLGGGTNAKQTLFTSDFTSLTDHAGKLARVPNSYITAADYDGSRWLVALTNGADQPANLYSFDGETLTDISSNLPPSTPWYIQNAQVVGDIPSITWNGHEWMIISASYRNQRMFVQLYDGTTFTDISDKFPNTAKNVLTATSNGSDWLVMGENGVLYKYADGQVTDLSSAVPSTLDKGGLDHAIWNAKDQKYYLAGRQVRGQTGDVNLELKAWVVTYDGSVFQDISANFPTRYITALATNNQGEVMVGGYSWDYVYLYRNGVVEHMPLRQINAGPGNYVRSIEADGRGFLLGGWGGTIVKVTYK